MRIASLAVLILTFASTSFAQVEASPQDYGIPPGSVSPPPPSLALQHSYDVLNYHLYMDWYNVLANKSLRYDGIMQITFRPDLVSPLDSIRLSPGAPYLTVDSVTSGGRSLNFTSDTAGIYIILDKPLASSDTAVVSLYYHVDNAGPSGYANQRGFYLYYGGEKMSGGYVVPQTVAYTMSEPSDARYWMPCYDEPSDKALSEISVRVPDAYTAASNGKLESVVNNGDGSRTFNWVEHFPIATYLMCATASIFSVVTADYIRAPGDTVPVQYYVYPEDSVAAATNPVCNVDSVVSMMKFYSSIYGQYPFEKYAMACIEPFQYGGMEHTTMTTLNRKYEFSRYDVAHELAHHWFGDNITLGTWKDIWLNEGFATYSEAMQLQHVSQPGFTAEMNYEENEYFMEYDTAKYAIYAPPPALIFGLAEYYKAAWVLNMLRNIEGDSVFFDILRTYLADFRFGTAVTSNFINVASQVTHTNMDWFFDEWIYGQGYPIYSFTYKTFPGSFTFYLKQNQINAPIFRMPVDVGVYSGGQETTFNFVDSLNLQTVRFSYPGTIDSVVFDPGDKIFKQVTAWTDTTLPTLGSPPSIQVYPNPFNGVAQIQYSLGVDSQVTIDVYDIIGRKVESLNEGSQQAGAYQVSVSNHNLASGVYFFRLHTDSGNSVTKALLLK